VANDMAIALSKAVSTPSLSTFCFHSSAVTCACRTSSAVPTDLGPSWDEVADSLFSSSIRHIYKFHTPRKKKRRGTTEQRIGRRVPDVCSASSSSPSPFGNAPWRRDVPRPTSCQTTRRLTRRWTCRLTCLRIRRRTGSRICIHFAVASMYTRLASDLLWCHALFFLFDSC
jgi:hypothetical protein